MILMETKINIDRAPPIFQQLKIPNNKIFPSEGFQENLATWKDKMDFQIEIISTNSRFIHSHTKDNTNHFSQIGTFIMVMHNKTYKKILLILPRM